MSERVESAIGTLMKGVPPLPDDQVTLANWREPRFARWSFSHMRQLLPTSPITASSCPFDLTEARQDLGSMRFAGADGGDLRLDTFLRRSQTDCFAVMHNGKLVYDWFDGFGAPDRPHILFSVSKSLTALVVGVLVEQGVLDVKRTISTYVPEVAGSAYEDATLRQLLDMTVASSFVENYEDVTGVFMAYRRASAWNPVEEGHSTDGLRAFLAKMPAARDGQQHGNVHHYCSPHTDMLGWVIERVSGMSLSTLFSQLIMQPCGTRHEAYITLDSFGAPRAAGGYCMAVHDLLQIAEMTRCEGALGGQQIVPASWVNDFRNYAETSAWKKQKSGEGPRLFPHGTYRAKWYKPGFEEDEYCAIGIHGQWIWANPKRETVIVRMASNGTAIDTNTDRDLLCALQAVARAVG
ncbi:MAG: serine hydrolase [Candidatus Puniceispirillum sp.]|jgi:CubicO group peptidase (beta-lactamase class C family)|nr:serine hydrolase [Candidatus Puniceispirillum sp.]